jgi:translation initiation factor 5
VVCSKSSEVKDDDAGGSNSEDADETQIKGDDEEEDDGTEWKTDLSADAIARRQREQLTSAAAALVQGPPVRVRPQRSLYRRKHLMHDSSALQEGGETGGDRRLTDEASVSSVPAAAAATSGDEEVEGKEESDDEGLEPVERVRRYLRAGKPPLGLLDLLGELEVSGGLVGRMKVFYAALLGGGEGKLADRMAPLDKYILALKRDDKHQASNLIALEHYLTQVEPDRLVEMPFLLKMLYEEDLVEDQVIIAWGAAPAVARKHGVDKTSAERIREVSQKVLEWLDEDSDEEDEEEEE